MHLSCKHIFVISYGWKWMNIHNDCCLYNEITMQVIHAIINEFTKYCRPNCQILYLVKLELYFKRFMVLSDLSYLPF